MTENISKLRIEGGTPLVGEVHVRGAKNLVPKAMVAALHGSTLSTLRNVPDLSDVEIVTTSWSCTAQRLITTAKLVF